TFEGAISGHFTITDPALAGTIAVASADDDDQIQRFLAAPQPAPMLQQIPGKLLLVDRAGTAYSVDRHGLIVTARDRETRLSYPIAIPPRHRHQARVFPGLAVTHDTRWIAMSGSQEVAVIDQAGAVRWRRPVRAVDMRWTADDRRLIVVTDEGVLAL